ncbi:carbonate dehydratase [Prosthecomicrobium hirschii]|uniref:carbonic anhydrase n=1 Tax=Prosthecodimorpha hirschii TaxID=665126 RepID=UPI001126FE33|nr:carbonic anhydrase [Prosthecomicrobium hirschii]TPQ52305.1 carbonate dehydratase [Prosthecomicrobium hirschii]
MLPTRLLHGYRNFRSGRYTVEHERYRHLAEAGQKPETMIIACCDSRAAPELIFDAPPGDLFVVRNVANLVPPYTPDGEHHGTSAALEFAVMALRVKTIVVMGHGRCGGIAAALNENAEPLSPGDFIGKWISLLEQPVAECACHQGLAPDQRRLLLERISIRHSLNNLRSFPCVNTLESRGKLALHGAWFDISLGELHVYDEAADQWQALGDAAPDDTGAARVAMPAG